MLQTPFDDPHKRPMPSLNPTLRWIRLAHSGCRVTLFLSECVDGGSHNRRSELVAYSHSIEMTSHGRSHCDVVICDPYSRIHRFFFNRRATVATKSSVGLLSAAWTDHDPSFVSNGHRNQSNQSNQSNFGANLIAVGHARKSSKDAVDTPWWIQTPDYAQTLASTRARPGNRGATLRRSGRTRHRLTAAQPPHPCPGAHASRCRA